VDACIGKRRSVGMAPTAVPKQCHAAARRLENCLEQQQRMQEDISHEKWWQQQQPLVLD